MRKEKEILDSHLREKGLKKTTQRYKILEIFLSTTGHVSAYELHSMIKKRHPNIGFSTVYRTLKLFTQCGLAREVDFGEGLSRFEKAFKRAFHGHLVCSRCGRTEEFFSQAVDNVQKQVAGRLGYKTQGYRFEIYGLCKRCHE